MCRPFALRSEVTPTLPSSRLGDPERPRFPVDRPIETAVETGDPGEASLGYVDVRGVDHVVMGERGGEKRDRCRRTLGTVASTVVGKAPVTVVRWSMGQPRAAAKTL